jgi:leader peptidase (prepilin peptidase)/N-methyltransferase
MLKGACRGCGVRISIRYPLVELLTAILTVSVAAAFGVTFFTLGALGFAWALIALSFIDFDTQLLPDNITLPLLWGGVLFNLVTGSIPLEDSVIGAVIGYGILWSICWIFKLLTRKEGMGHGDFKLMAAIGAFLGYKSLHLVVLLSSSIGALVGVCMILFAGHKRGAHIPFGPYLALAGIVTLFVQRLNLGYIGFN